MTDEEMIEKAVNEGIISSALGNLLRTSTNKNINDILAKSAMIASLSAFEESKNTGEPVLYVKKGALYKSMPNGSEVLVKKIPHQKSKLPKYLNNKPKN